MVLDWLDKPRPDQVTNWGIATLRMTQLQHLLWLRPELAAVGWSPAWQGRGRLRLGPPAKSGFHWSVVTLAVAISQGAWARRASGSAQTEPIAALGAQPVLEQQARE